MDTVRSTDPETSRTATKSVNTREDVQLAFDLVTKLQTNGSANGLTRGEFGARVLQHLIDSKWRPDRPIRKGQSLRMARIRRSDSIRRRLSDLIDKNDGRLAVSAERRDKQAVLKLAAA